MTDGRRRILVDINIFIDIIERRMNWQNSLAVISAVDRKIFGGYVSAATKLVLDFRRARIRGDEAARIEVKDILKSFRVVPLDEPVLASSFADKKFDDVEDAVQFHSALKVAQIIVTRNKIDYKQVAGEIEVLNPEELMEKYAKAKGKTW
ncbi:MAG: PIN domain-containing protein [Thaumarchaeota archaeon]|nr:PIN domain-containing protein [Nitrososphaerota archaeon]